ncbi:MAG: membrane protein insertase YidC, partial [Caulobacteraceae bacterium]
MNEDTRNWIAFSVIALILFVLYQQFVIGPAAKRAQSAHAHAVAAAPAGPVKTFSEPDLSRPAALVRTQRVAISTPSLVGSLAVQGARIDDLFLRNYHVDVSNSSPMVELLRPEGMQDAYFAVEGWSGANLAGLPGANTAWSLAKGGPLSPGHPVVLTYSSPTGLSFTRTISVDPKFLFTVTDQVVNQSASSVVLDPYVSIQRQGLPPDPHRSSIVHEGAVGVLGVGSAELRLASYKDWLKKGEEDWQSKGGWLGITDKYWMTAFIPTQSDDIAAKIRVVKDPTTGIDIYEATYSASPRSLAPGASLTFTSHLFSGAKTVPVLKTYEKAIGAPRFDDAVDWGHLWFLTKPI